MLHFYPIVVPAFIFVRHKVPPAAFPFNRVDATIDALSIAFQWLTYNGRAALEFVFFHVHHPSMPVHGYCSNPPSFLPQLTAPQTLKVTKCSHFKGHHVFLVF